MPYNYSKLKGKIKEVCGTQEVFARTIGMAPTTLSQKLNNKAEWSQNEMFQTASILGIERSKLPEFFFDE